LRIATSILAVSPSIGSKTQSEQWYASSLRGLQAYKLEVLALGVAILAIMFPFVVH
jgi:hypothetical protein